MRSAPLGVILAGGQGRRMGGADKALLRLGGRTLLDRAEERLGPQVADMALSVAGDPARFDTAMPMLSDPVEGFAGPLAGVLAALDWAAGQRADHVVSVAVDTPFFPEDLVPRLLLASEGRDPRLALAETTRLHPAFGLWPVSLRGALRQALDRGEHKVGRWAEDHDAARARFPVGAFDPFLNINTPEDLAQAEEILA